ncbi:MAG: type II secretion system GspH family protein [Candidatus Gastranaerophilales bacterium]|nr:type II secretion system GspH family protein [Candidatus Gastranaerophilales bacterium]
MINKSGVTLAETLLALVVLGIVASMTIPALMMDYNNKENILGYKRAVNMLNKAYAEYAEAPTAQYETKYRTVKRCPEGTSMFNFLGIEFCAGFSGGIHIDPVISEEPYLEKSTEKLDPVSIGAERLNSDEFLMKNLFEPFVSIAFKELMDSTNPMAGCGSDAQIFYTTDGMRYCFKYSASAAVNSEYGEKTYGIMWVDVNGEKGPNAIPTSTKTPGDTFPIVIMKNRFIPGHPTDSDMATLSQTLYYGERETSE